MSSNVSNFDTNLVSFDTMPAKNKVRYLKIDRGRYFYQRRVPKILQELVEEKVWLRPCGAVTYSKAVQLVVTWAEEHDQFIDSLKSVEDRQSFATNLRRTEEATFEKHVANEKMEHLFFNPNDLEENIDATSDPIKPTWAWAKWTLEELEIERDAKRPNKLQLAQLKAKIAHAIITKKEIAPTRLPPFKEFQEIVFENSDLIDTKNISFTKELPLPLTPDDYLDELKKIWNHAFSVKSPSPPSDKDELDEYEFVRRKLERKISELTPDPNTITVVSEKYFNFNSIKTATRSKYRRDIGRLVGLTGDIPVKKIDTLHLKTLRDNLSFEMKSASLHAVFTPIKGLLKYAAQEELIDHNPMSVVILPKDKRPIEERKWKKFEPDETQRIFDAVNDMWGNPMLGLTEERRNALAMVVKALMFTGMRPIEVLRLNSEDIDQNLIRIKGSKTESSTRVIPLHPELKDLPHWIKTGGLNTFNSIQTDKVGSVRHNFARLIRELMNPPILDKQKALYSLRGTFVNAMRRAGADIQMQRAILGHKEAGAIRHYDDGPEFALKYEMVAKTDPRKI